FWPARGCSVVPPLKSIMSCLGWRPRTCASASTTAAATVLAAGFGDGTGLLVGGAEADGVAAGMTGGRAVFCEPVTAAVRATVPPNTANAPEAPTTILAQAGRLEKFMRTTVGGACKHGR